MKFTFLPLTLLFSLLLFFSCKMEKFTGYDTSGQTLLESVRITGQVFNRYIGSPVADATVNVAGLETLTDFNGNFSIRYLLTEDDYRNKPVKVLVSAENYYSYETDINIDVSGTNRFEFQLSYAAPIIDAVARVFVTSMGTDYYYCQAIIHDYQGARNIKRVTATFPYQKKYADRKPLTYELNLVEVSTVSANIGYFQCRFEYDPDLSNIFTVEAVDNDGYSASMFHAIDAAFPDRLLFNPF